MTPKQRASALNAVQWFSDGKVFHVQSRKPADDEVITVCNLRRRPGALGAPQEPLCAVCRWMVLKVAKAKLKADRYK